MQFETEIKALTTQKLKKRAKAAAKKKGLSLSEWVRQLIVAGLKA